MNSSLIIPKAQNEYATKVADRIDDILTIASPDVAGSFDRRQQMATALVVAANELKKDSCYPSSVLMAAFHATYVGLTPGSALGLAYFIPRKRKREDRLARCQLEIGYKGFLDLAFGNQFLERCHAEVVLDGEEFKYWVDADGPQILHDIPNPLERPIKNTHIRKHVRGAYCIYHPRSGGRGIRWLTRDQLDEVDTKSNVWASNYFEMCRKSAIRRAAKDWKLTQQMANAITLDEQAERDDDQDIGLTSIIDQEHGESSSEVVTLQDL